MQHLEMLGELVERAARECGSKTKLAERLGVSPQRLNEWRTGYRDCPPEDVALIADAAGLPADQWLVRATLWKHKEKPKGARLREALGKWSASTGGAITTFFLAAGFGSDLVRSGLSTMYIMLN
jgi:DNA-binding transcriptional regulator YdaS (Cro superfamily)